MHKETFCIVWKVGLFCAPFPYSLYKIFCSRRQLPQEIFPSSQHERFTLDDSLTLTYAAEAHTMPKSTRTRRRLFSEDESQESWKGFIKWRSLCMNDAKKRDFSGSDRRAYNTKHSTSRKEQRATMDFFSFLWICTGEEHRRDEESAKEQLQWWIFNVFLLQNPFRFSTLCVTLLCFEAHTSIRWSSRICAAPFLHSAFAPYILKKAI